MDRAHRTAVRHNDEAMTQQTQNTRPQERNNRAQYLQYLIGRYRAMGNGAKCQTLNSELRRLLAGGTMRTTAL